MRLFLLVPALLLAAACNTQGAGRARTEPSETENIQNRFDAKMLGLTADIDRLSRRVAELEARLGPGAPPPVPPAARKETPPEPPDLFPAAEPGSTEEAMEEPTAKPPPQTEAEPAPMDEIPPPETAEFDATISWTGLLFDVRTLSEVLPPGRAYVRWRVADPDGVDLLTNADVIRKSGSTFWQAAEGAALGEKELPLTGATPLRVVPTRAAVLTDGEARLFVDAEAAKLIRGCPGLPDLLANGKLAILLLTPSVR